MDTAAAERSLLAFDALQRRAALDLLASAAPSPARPVGAPLLINLHCHTFYSYNGYGHTPSSLAWLARQSGWYALGTVDFDVLDGVDETLTAAESLGLRACASLETRAIAPDTGGVEYNSPGEPGVMYVVGVGFASSTPAPSAAETLADMRQRAALRNCEMVARINRYLADVSIDYDRDVLPLTPAGNATERHILVAYDVAARRVFAHRAALVQFWAERLAMTREAVEGLLTDAPFPHDAVRARLMKRGGPGYLQPGPDAFPPIAEVYAAIRACGAAPSYPFLDGTSEGERDLDDLLDRQIVLGAEAVTIIPERNWNLRDTAERDDKVARLRGAIAAARRRGLPVLVGTEMNKHGQRLVDDLTAADLAPYRCDFRRGADWAYGHTLLQRRAGLGTASAWAGGHLGDRARRTEFYAAVGRAVPPAMAGTLRVPEDAADAGPDAVLDWCTRLTK